jgi:sugar diacid utilization regulator
VACAAAGRVRKAPPRWLVLGVHRSDGRTGRLAVGPPPEADDGSAAVVSLLPPLLTGQLQRAGLRAGALAARRATFVRGLVRDRQFDSDAVEREAADVSVPLAKAYHAGVLAWPDGAPRPGMLQAVQVEATRLAPRSLNVAVDGVVVLLYPEGPDAAPPASAWMEHVVRFARLVGSSQTAQVLAGGPAHPVPELRDAVNDLLVLSRFLGAARDGTLVVPVERFGLEHLLSRGLDPRAATAFVDAQLRQLVAWDADHDDHLLEVLEAALDLPRHGLAAERCFMHRNTFREHLRHAVELAGGSLEEPERRLALHVAMKLRRVLAEPPRRSLSPSESP